MQTNPYMMMLEKEEADTSPNPMSMAGRRRLLMRMRASEPPAPPPAKDAPAKEKVSAIKLNAEEEKQKAVVSSLSGISQRCAAVEVAGGPFGLGTNTLALAPAAQRKANSAGTMHFLRDRRNFSAWMATRFLL